MFGTTVGFSGTDDLMAKILSSKNPRWRPAVMFDILEWP